jgi:hypothetical protein
MWAAFAAATTPQELCQHWLILLAEQVKGVMGGLVLLHNPADGAYVPAAVWPDPLTDVTSLAPAAQQALTERRGVVLLPSDLAATGAAAPPGIAQVALPIVTAEALHGVAVLAVATTDRDALQTIRRRLFWASAWLTNLFLRDIQTQAGIQLERAALALDIALLGFEKSDFQETLLALVNAIAVKLELQRVSLGLVRRGDIRVRAVSHVAHFERRSDSIRVIQQAMEEAHDQHRTLCAPEPPGAAAADRGLTITSAQARLAEQTAAGAVASFVLSTRGEAGGVLTLEYPEGKALSEDDLLTGEMVARLLAPVVAQGQELERWFAGKLRRRLHYWRDALLGPYHASYKLAAIAAILLMAVLLLVKGEFRITAKTVIEGLVQRAAVAPFEGFIQQAPVRAGDRVQAGQLLATLDDKDLRLEQMRWSSEQEQTLRKYREAQAHHDRASASVLGAQLNQIGAQLALVEEKLARTQIRAPFDGLVVTGDLSQLLGAPVTQGKVLFEIAPLDSYRVILKVDERDIRYVAEGQKGQLALSGLTKERLGFTVIKVTPVATAEEGSNFFRVEAQLEEPGTPLRPGMEGIGKIVVGEGHLGWLWTRRLIDWARLTFWRWLP